MTKHFHISSREGLLDRPIWGALTTRLEHLSNTLGTTRAFADGISPMAASAGFGAGHYRDFLTLIGRRSKPLVTLELNAPVCAGQYIPEDSASVVQMVAKGCSGVSGRHRIEDLGNDDAEEMYQLATAMKPGPFERKTHMMGDFIGVRTNGRLIAMAGQRLRLPGYIEISAVCVAADYQSQGIGADLVRDMSQRIFDQGEIPFLHAYQSNKNAIALYETLGFEIRTTLQATIWARNVLVQSG